MSSNSNDKTIAITIITTIGLIAVALIDNWDKNVSTESDTINLEELHTSPVKSVIRRAMNKGSEAYRKLDPSLAKEVFKDEAFRSIKEEIEVFKSKGVFLDRKLSDLEYRDISFDEKPLRAKVRLTRTLEQSAKSLETGQCVQVIPRWKQEQTYHLEYQDKIWMISTIELHNSAPEQRLPCP